MADPFFITGPALISFSGGRTSAYMLWRIIQAHGGVWPENVVVVFMNTGDEREETLAFVRECAERWGVKVIWLEWRPKKSEREPHWEAWVAVNVLRAIERGRACKTLVDISAAQAEAEAFIFPIRDWWRAAAARCGDDGFEVVDFETASRKGEPFSGLIAKKGMLPNRGAGFCSIELKGRVAQAYAQAVLGWKRWTTIIGLRADEMDRAINVAARNKAGKDRWKSDMPLLTAGITRRDVLVHWLGASMRVGREVPQGFDLGLFDYEGNCWKCWKKSFAKVARIVRDARAAMNSFWEDHERFAFSAQPQGRQFRSDMTMAEIGEHVANSPAFDFDNLDVDDHDAECGLWCPSEAA